MLLPLLLRRRRRRRRCRPCAPWQGQAGPLRRASRRLRTPRPFPLPRLAGWLSPAAGWRRRGASASGEGEEEEQEEQEGPEKSSRFRRRRPMRRRRRMRRKTPPKTEASSFFGTRNAARPLLATTKTHPDEQRTESILGPPRRPLLGRAGRGRRLAALIFFSLSSKGRGNSLEFAEDSDAVGRASGSSVSERQRSNSEPGDCLAQRLNRSSSSGRAKKSFGEEK